MEWEEGLYIPRGRALMFLPSDFAWDYVWKKWMVGGKGRILSNKAGSGTPA